MEKNGNIMGSGIHAPLSGNKYILSTQPAQLSSHHSCRQEEGGTTVGHWHSPRDLSLSAKQEYTACSSFTPAGLSQSGNLFSPQPLPAGFFSSSSPARRELMYGSWLKWLYVRTCAHIQERREFSMSREGCGRCDVPWEKRCRVISRYAHVSRHHPAFPFFHSMPEFTVCVLMYQFRRTFNREEDINTVSWDARVDRRKKNSEEEKANTQWLVTLVISIT